MSAFRIDAAGALTPHGQPIPLPSRPIHLTTDIPSEYVLVAFNNPSALRVYRINGDATLGEEVQQPGAIDAGILRTRCATANNRLAILVTRVAMMPRLASPKTRARSRCSTSERPAHERRLGRS